MFSRKLLIALFLILAGGANALAEDPPGRVGRVAYLEGDVMQRAAQQDEWSPATVNFPVTTGHSLWTEAGALAEVQVGPAAIRLKERTELDVLSLDDRSQILALRQGTVAIRLRTAAPDLRLDTPRGVISFPKPGSYRIDVEDSTMTATVLDGEAHLEEQQGAHILRQGESARIHGQPRQIEFAQAQSTPFDAWTLERERATGAPKTLTHVSPQMTGYQDLDTYGTWDRAPEYGAVWYPRVVVDDWAPYRHGHWAYVRPWGWTWIDDAPWGFAPFHYGRWVRVGHRWAWWPGAYIERPVYAPALVAFIGGDSWSVSVFSGRDIGWVPLAPYEIYRPHYRTSVTYVRNVNVTVVNKTVIKNISVRHHDHDREVARFKNHGAATVVSSDSFARSRHVHKARVEMPRERIAEARVSSEPQHIKPVAKERNERQPAHGPRRDFGAHRDGPRQTSAPTLTKPSQQTAIQSSLTAPAPVRKSERPNDAEREAKPNREPADTNTGRERHTERRAVEAPKAPSPNITPSGPRPDVSKREVRPERGHWRDRQTADSMKREPRVQRPEPVAEPRFAHPAREPERERAVPAYRRPEPPPQPRAAPQPQPRPQPQAAPAPVERQAAREDRRGRDDRPQRNGDDERRRERKERPS